MIDAVLATKADIRVVRDDIAKIKRLLDAMRNKLSWRMGVLIALAAASFGKLFF